MQLSLLVLPLLTYQGGLRITDTKVGKGDTAQVGDYLTMDYTGTLMNGKKFDSSIGKAPFMFILGAGQVIKGWDQGIKGMKVGGKRTLVIPAAMGYGAQGQGDIPPNSTLKFTVELHKITRIKKTITKPGHGKTVQAGDNVQVLYTGKFTNGKKFDSSYDHGGQPMPVQIGGGVIPGFTMGLLGMREGEKRTIVIPSALAYGSRGAGGGVIPPNTDLVFDLEVVGISR